MRVAHALVQLPKVSDAMRCGRVSYSKVRAFTRVATPETEQSLLDVALAGTAAHVERVVRAWRQTDRAAERDEDRQRQADRSLRTWVDDDGMVVVRGRLTPEVGAVFRRALEAAVAADRGAAVDGGGTVPADAVDEAVGVGRSLGQRQADALGRLAECALAGGLDRGTAGDRYQVVLHVDAEALVEDPPPSTTEPAGGDGDGLDAGGADGNGAFPRERRGRCAGRPPVRDRAPDGRRRSPRTAASASGRRRPAASPATPPQSPCSTDPTAACWTSAAGPGPPLPRCAGRSPRATGSAGSPAARPGAAMCTISITGPTAACTISISCPRRSGARTGPGRWADGGRPRSPTSSCCAGRHENPVSYSWRVSYCHAQAIIPSLNPSF